MDSTVVWFKRDLRLSDHAPLWTAARQGPVLCLYILEPSLWRQPDAARQHYEFLRESLRDLAQALHALGARLELAVGEACAVLERLFLIQPFGQLVSHEETGNAHTYARDRAVMRWCRQHDVAWREWPQHGVVRRLRNRDNWYTYWQAHMQATIVPPPSPDNLRARRLPWRDRWPDASELGLDAHDPPQRQRGGRTRALQVLDDFLHRRSAQYRGGISSPLLAPSACSRLSPYLALGCLGMRETVQITHARRQALALHTDVNDARRAKGLAAFQSRLYWHCHFIQKLESEPEIEHRNLHRGYDGLREPDWCAEYFEALQQGRTGWPMVDACVSMLRETGWLNFRMRAMLVSVASYPLWLHWRPVGLWLARQFLDYEPGIHWSQMQMQAGTTGINTTRIYNPLKQARDHDPQGHFVRHWLPALRRVPDSWLFEPWRMPETLRQSCGLTLGQDIWVPLVDLTNATRTAKTRLYSRRTEPAVRLARAAIVEKHASRRVRPPSAPASDPAKTPATPAQFSLNF